MDRTTARGAGEAASAFVATAALLVLCALRGGSFDVVPRAELGLAAWWAVALGWALGVLPRARLGRGAALPLAGFAGLAAWTALSLSWTESDERTAAELARLAQHAGVLVLALSLLSRRTWRAAVAGAAAGALIVSGVAVASRLWPAGFPTDQVGVSFGRSRLNYPLNYWNAVGAWSAVATTLALAWSAHAERCPLRMLALAAVPVSVLATYLTYSRAGVAGTALGLIVVWAAARHRAVLLVHALAAALGAALAIEAVRRQPEIAHGTGGDGGGAVALSLAAAAALAAAVAWLASRLDGDVRWRLGPRPARTLAGVGAVGAIALGGLALPPAVPGALDAFRTRSAVSAADPAARLGTVGGARYRVWSSALAAFEAHPVHGTGAGTFEFWWSRDARDREFMVDAHSLYLEALAELGVPGLLCVLLVCAGGLLACGRARMRAATAGEAGAATACLGGVVVWLFHAGVDWMWESTATVVLAIALVAAAVMARSAAPPHVRPAVRASVAGLALVAVAVQLPALVGASSLRASQAATRGHDARAAVAAAEDAAAILPWAASPRIQLALLAEQRGALALAEREARRAMALEPTNWRHPLLLARVLAERGDAPGALRAFELARRLRPLAGAFRAASVSPPSARDR